jgi:hypothetical protein
MQRSEDGINFRDIAVVAAKGSNNSYTHTDSISFTGNVYYRIKSVDIDGRFSFSRVLWISNENTGSDVILISPNPVINDIFVIAKSVKKQDIQFQLISQEGKPIRSFTRHMIQGINSFSIENSSNLPKGIYFLRAITADGTMSANKVVVR